MLVRLLLALLLALPVVACTPNLSNDDDDATSDDDDATEPPGASLSGTILDESGAGLEGLVLTACSDERCIFANSAADGTFTFGGLVANGYVVHNISYPGGTAEAILQYCSAYDLVQTGEEDSALSQPLVVSEVTETYTPVDGANTATFGDGVEVTWDEPIAPPLTAITLDEVTLGAAEIAEANWASALDDREVLRAWCFTPFEIALEDDNDEDDDDFPFSFEVRMPVDGLDAGDDVSFVYAHYDDNIVSEEFSEHPAAVSADGAAVEGEVSNLGVLYAVRN